MAPIDPHSFTESTHPLATHISLSLFFDFPSSTIHASALFTLPAPHSGPLSLDARALTVHSVLDPQSSAPLPFSLSSPDPIKGCHLTVSLSNHSSFLIVYPLPLPPPPSSGSLLPKPSTKRCRLSTHNARPSTRAPSSHARTLRRRVCATRKA
ncbi:leukotriene A-4 hydrolase homolog [Prunus yedoensis var. nudiflora]|uniref:Leukotriene A-4 hydrolase homolog n=1 Tax=Prunus yedoensis var. nudiflora TaxID=2094558 RepID=A0A314ZLG2_PRUYE|nr:leukotriene A-4 hydrolase homolog [Prunus yedoensis var. nudiflora]